MSERSTLTVTMHEDFHPDGAVHVLWATDDMRVGNMYQRGTLEFEVLARLLSGEVMPRQLPPHLDAGTENRHNPQN